MLYDLYDNGITDPYEDHPAWMSNKEFRQAALDRDAINSKYQISDDGYIIIDGEETDYQLNGWNNYQEANAGSTTPKMTDYLDWSGT
jgi:hypothetical protein